MRILALFSLVIAVAGVALIVTGAALPGALVLVASFAIAGLLGTISMARGLRDTFREWRSLFSGGGPQSIRVVAIQPPEGMVFKRDATVELEITGQDGSAKRLQREVPVPVPQAIVWKLAGRAPGPLRALARGGETNVPIWKRRARS